MQSGVPLSYSLPDLMRLAQAYSEGTGKSLSWIDTQITGSRKFFCALARNPQSPVKSPSMVKATTWFDREWPSGVLWPAEVQRHNGIDRTAAKQMTSEAVTTRYQDIEPKARRSRKDV